MIWYLKQLLPFKYETRYGDKEGWHHVVWQMWLGRCFNIHRKPIPTPEDQL